MRNETHKTWDDSHMSNEDVNLDPFGLKKDSGKDTNNKSHKESTNEILNTKHDAVIPFSAKKRQTEDDNMSDESYEEPVLKLNTVVKPSSPETTNAKSKVPFQSPARKISAIISAAVEENKDNPESIDDKASDLKRKSTVIRTSMYAASVSVVASELSRPNFDDNDLERKNSEETISDNMMEISQRNNSVYEDFNGGNVLLKNIFFIKLDVGDVNPEDYDNIKDWLNDKMKQFVYELHQPNQKLVRELTPRRYELLEFFTYFQFKCSEYLLEK